MKLFKMLLKEFHFYACIILAGIIVGGCILFHREGMPFIWWVLPILIGLCFIAIHITYIGEKFEDK